MIWNFPNLLNGRPSYKERRFGKNQLFSVLCYDNGVGPGVHEGEGGMLSFSKFRQSFVHHVFSFHHFFPFSPVCMRNGSFEPFKNSEKRIFFFRRELICFS